MDRLDLSYQILTVGERELLVTENLIETARWLEEQELVRCTCVDGGMRVQLNLKGIDAWVKSEFDRLCVKWRPYKPCIYGIALLNKTSRLIENGHTRFTTWYQCFWIQTSEPPKTYGKKDIVVHFADIFCQKIDLHQLVERIANEEDITFVLNGEKNRLQ